MSGGGGGEESGGGGDWERWILGSIRVFLCDAVIQTSISNLGHSETKWKLGPSYLIPAQEVNLAQHYLWLVSRESNGRSQHTRGRHRQELGRGTPAGYGTTAAAGLNAVETRSHG